MGCAHRQTQRLTTGRRARDPAVSPDGRRVAFSMNEHSTACSRSMEIAPDAPGESCGRRSLRQVVSAGVVARRHAHRVLRVAHRRLPRHPDRRARDGQDDEVTHDRAVDMSPAWSRDGKHAVLRQRPHRHHEHLRVRPRRRARPGRSPTCSAARCTREPSPDGKRLAFEHAVPAGGYDLYEMPIDRATWLPARDFFDDKPRAGEDPRRRIAGSAAARRIARSRRWRRRRGRSQLDARDAHGDDPDRRLRRGRAARLLARASALDLDTATRTSARRTSTPAGGRRSASPARARSSQRGGWRDRRRQQDVSPRRTGAATLSLGIPFESRPSSHWTLSFDYDTDWYRLVDGADRRRCSIRTMRVAARPATELRPDRRRARASRTRACAAWTFGARPQHGFDASVVAALDHPALGAHVSQRHAELRAPTATSGCGARRRCSRCASSVRCAPATACAAGGFALGGVPAQDVAQSIVNSTRTSSIGYLRGYGPRAVAGNQYHLLNLEYRQELWHDRARHSDVADLLPPHAPRGAVGYRHGVRHRRSMPIDEPALVARRGARGSTRSSATSSRERSRSVTRTA